MNSAVRNLRKITQKNITNLFIRRTFLIRDYKCLDEWSKKSPLINNINLNDFYNQLDQNYSSRGTLSAVDIDIFANAVKDVVHLEELKDLLHKLRLTAETGNTLESTHHATVRNFINFGYVDELVDILKNPLEYGIFLDDYAANILLDELIKQNKFELAANVAGLIMLQEEYSNEITCSLSKFATFKYIMEYSPPEQSPPEDKSKKVEEKKIRIKFLRNPYFDDHFDIKDTYLLSGKTLAWISDQTDDNLNKNLQLAGWLIYKKINKLLLLCEKLENKTSFKLYPEIMKLLNGEKDRTSETDLKDNLERCIHLLNKHTLASESLEDAIKLEIENAINKRHNKDILIQKQLYQTWENIREQKLEEQTKRLDRAKRTKLLQEKQNEMEEEEQKLWFFESEDKIDLQIEEKEKLKDKSTTSKKSSKVLDDNYIPPEILPRRKQ